MVSVLWLVHWFGKKRAGLLLVEVRDVKDNYFWIPEVASFTTILAY